ncbi:hypothetical protein [Streptococcus equi]|uniref:hypothetical protein n=1 Tax=Streptococcus equi TaxID=1336 RepID=UPI001E614C5F|nr:hypothetical protein [Streptococcus equi]
MMPQLHAPLKGITIKQAISSIGKIRGLSGKLLETEVQELIQELGLIKWQNTVGEKTLWWTKKIDVVCNGCYCCSEDCFTR